MRPPKPCCRNDAATWNPAWPAPAIRMGPCCIRSGRHDAKRHCVEPAQRVVQPQFGLACQFERRDALCKCAEDDLAFEPRHSLADTAVNAGSERHMPRRAPPYVKRIGLVPAAW